MAHVKNLSLPMIRLYCIISLVLFSGGVHAQTTKLPDAFSFSFLWTDYNSLDPVYQAEPLNEGRFLHAEDVNYAVAFGYQHTINASFNLGATIRLGSMDSHHQRYIVGDTACQPCEERIREEFFVSGELIGQYKFANGYLLPENFPLRPYIFVGVGLVHMEERAIKPDLQLPVGLGFNVHLSPRFALQVEGAYRKSLLVAKDNLTVSAGIVWLLKPKDNE